MKKIHQWNMDHICMAVMCTSMICCLTLLGSVVLDRPLTTQTELHVPVLHAQTEHDSPVLTQQLEETELPAEEAALPSPGYALTEEGLQAMLEESLPEDFPAESIRVKLENGLLELHMAMRRASLISYLKQRGASFSMKQSLALKLLPSQLEAAVAFSLSADEAGLHFCPLSLTAGDKSISLSGMPEDLFAAVDQAVNQTLEKQNIHISSLQWTEQGLLLR